jgi:hypothetical protein
MRRHSRAEPPSKRCSDGNVAGNRGSVRVVATTPWPLELFSTFMWLRNRSSAKRVLPGRGSSAAVVVDDGKRLRDSFKYVCAIGLQHRNVSRHPIALRADGVYLR